jgi:hypothetical protein
MRKKGHTGTFSRSAKDAGVIGDSLASSSRISFTSCARSNLLRFGMSNDLASCFGIMKRTDEFFIQFREAIHRPSKRLELALFRVIKDLIEKCQNF